MPTPIAPLTQLLLPDSSYLNLASHSSSSFDGFGQIFNQAITNLAQKEQTANHAIARLAAGEDVELHQVMLNMQEAEVSFQLALEIRNKLVEAYQEIMRMQV